MDSEELLLRFVAVDQLSSVIDGIGKKIEQFGSMLSSVGGKAGAALGPVAETLGSAALAVGGLVGVGAGLFGVLDHLASQTAEYALHVEQLSNRLGINTDLVQTLYQSFKVLGDSTDSVDMMMTRLAKNLEAGGTTLKAYGLTLADIGVTSKNLNIAIPELADYFNKTATESQKAAISYALFGRSSVDVTAFLSMGSAGINRLTEEFRGLGLILDKNTLAIDTTAKLMQDKLHLVLQGLEMTIGNALIPAFMMLWDILGKILNPMGEAGGMARVLGQAFAQAVVWIAAFIGAITGTNVNLTDFVKESQSAIGTLTMMGGTASDAGAGVQGLTSNTKALTAALNDQLQAVQAQQKAYDESMQSQIDSLHAQDTAYNQVIDDQIRQLDVQKQQVQLTQQQDAMADKLATDATSIAAAQTDLARAPYLGISDLSNLQKNLLSAQKKQTEDVAQSAIDARIRDLDATKSTLELQKTHYDRATADQILGIEATKKAQDDYYKDQTKNIQNHLKELAEKDSKALAGGLATNSALGKSSGDLTKGIAGNMALTTDSINHMRDAGVGAANAMTGAFGNLIGTFDTLNRAVSTLKDFFGPSNGGWWSTDHISPALDNINIGPNIDWGKVWSHIPGFGGAEGAIVSQPTLALIGEAGPEILQPLDQAPGASALSGGNASRIEMLLEVIANAVTQPGNATGVAAAVNRVLSNMDHQRSRGVVSHSPA